MSSPSELRLIARNALHGKWKIAVLAGFLANLLGGGTMSNGSSSSSNTDTYINSFFESDVWSQLQPILSTVSVLLILYALVLIVIGGAIKLGYCKFNLNLIDGKEISVKDIFLT